MSDAGGFDVDRFQLGVDKVIAELLDSFGDQVSAISEAWLYGTGPAVIFGDPGPTSKGAKTEAQARSLLKEQAVRKAICAALQQGAKSAFDIGKIITPILVGLVLAGTIVFPLTPVLFGMMAIVIAQIGTAALCAEYKGEKASGKAE